MAIARQRQSNIWHRELNDLVRGASGGFLFGVPLLYTMEVWWIGSVAQWVRLLVALVVTFAIIFLLNRTAGFRRSSDLYITDAAIDSIEALAIGVVCAGIILVILQEITVTTPLNEALGKLIYESVPFTLGVALANQFLQGDRQEHPPENRSRRSANSLNATFSDIGGTLIGATIIAFNIAPTDEVPILASAVSGFWLLAIMLISLVVSYGIVFAAGFANQRQRRQQKGIFQRPLSETVAAYLVALIAAAAMLVFFDKLRIGYPWQLWLNYTLILGLPASIGGAAGRLAI